MGLVGEGNKNKDGGLEDQTQTVKTVCVKCTKQVQKRTNCDVCKNLYHFKCDGTTKKQVDDSGIFVCKKSRASCTKCDEFQTYKGKVSKEIINLKNNINELEKTIEHLNNELSVIHKQYEEVDQDYKREKKLRRKFQDMCEKSRSRKSKKWSDLSSLSSTSYTSDSSDDSATCTEFESEYKKVKAKNKKSTETLSKSKPNPEAVSKPIPEAVSKSKDRDDPLIEDPKTVLSNLNKMEFNIETKRKVCYFFQKFGNCKYGVNCKYIHPQVVRDSGPNKEKICFQFQKFGNCKYNSNCRFIHKLPQRPKRNYRRGNFNEVNSVPDNHTVNRNSMQYPFLDEMRTLVGVLKDMIHRQVQLFPQATNQGSQQDSKGWGPPPPPTFQAVPMLHPSQSQGWQFVGG